MSSQRRFPHRMVSVFHASPVGKSEKQSWLLSRLILHVLCLSIVILCAGCLVVPTPENGLLAGRGQIDEGDIAKLEIGKTTPEDLLLKFGEPDLLSMEKSTYYYHWIVSHGYWMLAGGYQAAAGPIPKDYMYLFEFDSEGRLKRFEKSESIWRGGEMLTGDWVPPGGERHRSYAEANTILIDPIPSISKHIGFIDNSKPPVRLHVGEFRFPNADQESAFLIGHKKAAFGVNVADVRTNRSATDIVRGAIAGQLQENGCLLVEEDQDVEVTGQLIEFEVSTQVHLKTWDAVGTLSVIVEFHSETIQSQSLLRCYQAKSVSQTFLGPSQEDFEKVMRLSLEEMLRQMNSDLILARFLDSNRPISPSIDLKETS